ncbi:sensor histidine kinase [Saccharopolyspora phatthalungensis]|uniref:histidine kinase n=1 Tax=Saccharopolyspora phatthalungensis TaxID=664693 RepID=A0A840Q938_9PSEU|nr:DUF4118 domain-containing protein [Saccharopolyspora phatthalungensis]MBB5156447.1 two-component system sensor histidine kinase KdpD [Saccharopolyspora phatthalungensis]
MPRGRLRVYLGAAPGVGKTYAMLCEGHRRLGRGTDVVVGFVETYDRPRTTELLEGLEIIPRRTLGYRDAVFTELDVDAVRARHPQVALIDELAHTNVPGSRNAKRWQDIEEILDAGIDVISTVNIQHLESVNDVVEHITGIPQRETVPDEVVRRAEQVELVDMTAEALRRRMAHGNVYPPEKIDAALSNYFRVGNLTALRELALLWLADKVDEQLDHYRAEHDITGTWEARERVVVALAGGPEGDTLIRRAARIAERARGADLLAVHIIRGDGLSDANPAHLARQRALLENLGGTYHQVLGEDIPAALLDFARGVNATQLVLGASRRGRLAQLFSRGVGVTTTAHSGSIDVHMVTHEHVRHRSWLPNLGPGVGLRRRIGGFALAVLGIPLLTGFLEFARNDLSLPSEILLFLLLVVGIALVGGFWPAIAAALAGFLVLNYYFTPPIYVWTISDPDNLLALIVFVAVAIAVSVVVDLAARRTREAARARAEAAMLSNLSGSVLRGERPLPALLARLRETFGQDAVTLLERRPESARTPEEQHDPRAWQVVETVGAAPCPSPDAGDTHIAVGEDLAVALRGPTLPASDRRVLEAFATQAAVALRQHRLAEQAEQTRQFADANRMRTALLAAVSHDLRTPLASATAAIESLRSNDVAWSDEDEAELLDTAYQSLARLDRLVANLLDMSRLQSGTLGIVTQQLAVADAVPQALDGLDETGRVRVQIAETLPDVLADPGLLERVLANLIANALHYNPAEQPVLVTASALADHVEVRIIDRGPGIRQADYEKIFLPFQRLGDRDSHTGVGLGLALARGLTESMHGTLAPEETPGGGLTMVLTLPAAETPAIPRQTSEESRSVEQPTPNRGSPG